MSNTSRKCLFCGSRQPLSKEHILKQSWKKHFGEIHYKARDWGWRMDAAGNQVSLNRSFDATAFERTIKEVCKKCNNGWMNDLEIEAEQLILALIKGEIIELSLEDLTIITRWAAKTSFIVEAAHTKRRAGHKDQLTMLAKGDPPTNYFLWIYPLLPNGQAKFRCTEISFPPAGSTHPVPGSPMLNLISIQFFKAHFFSALTRDMPPEIFNKAINLTNVLGHPVQERINGWNWPPTSPAPVQLHDVMHSFAARYIKDRWNWILGTQ